MTLFTGSESVNAITNFVLARPPTQTILRLVKPSPSSRTSVQAIGTLLPFLLRAFRSRLWTLDSKISWTSRENYLRSNRRWLYCVIKSYKLPLVEYFCAVTYDTFDDFKLNMQLFKSSLQSCIFEDFMFFRVK